MSEILYYELVNYLIIELMESLLRPTPVLSVWAAINSLALPALPEELPPY